MLRLGFQKVWTSNPTSFSKSGLAILSSVPSPASALLHYSNAWFQLVLIIWKAYRLLTQEFPDSSCGYRSLCFFPACWVFSWSFISLKNKVQRCQRMPGVDPGCFGPEHSTLQYWVRAGWELQDAQCEFLQRWWNVFVREELSPSSEREQMDCRDPASAMHRGEEECSLLPPAKSISVLSEMPVKWDFSLQKWSSHVYLFSSLHTAIFFLCAYLSKVFTWSVGLKVISFSFFFSFSLFFLSVVPLFLKMSS